MDLGRTGLFTFALDATPAGQAIDVLAELHELGYGTVWLPEAVGKHPLVNAAILLSGTTDVVVATGIANIWARHPSVMASAHKTLTEAFPDRFLLGLGVSHGPMVEGMLGIEYGKPLTYMREYLDKMDEALYMGAAPSTEPQRCIGALGPKMLALAAEKTWGAFPYNVTPEHTARAREIVGSDTLVAPEQAVCLETDATRARELGREHLGIYLGLPNYVNNLKTLGFEDADFADGGSDRLIDAICPWGGVDAAAAAVQSHRDAGADHVCVQVIVPRDQGTPMEQWRALAPALAG